MGLEDIAINTGASAIIEALKGPNKKKAKKVALKVFKAIKTAFPDDPDFE